MDWRAMSRSRSRVPMDVDWRAASRSRSRPPLDLPQHNYYSDPPNSKLPPTAEVVEPKLGISPPIPIPGPSSNPTTHVQSLSSLSRYVEFGDQFSDASGVRFTHPVPFHQHSLSEFNSPVSHAASLPAHGLHGFPRMPAQSPQPAFPKHVRKTSFDHTVSREGILAGLSGRHQVNGKPRSPDSLVGTKRRADTPHAEGMLRGDLPLGMDMSLGANRDPYDLDNPFPSTAFNFSFPSYDTYFEMSGAGSPYPASLDATQDKHFAESFSEAGPSSLSNSRYSPTKLSPSIPNEGLSAAAVAASAAVAEGYALTGLDDSGLDYQPYNMNFMYPQQTENSNVYNSHVPFTHVDPMHILPADHNDNGQHSLHTSPSSDGWGLNSSNNPSPEPYNASVASTPPSLENAPNGVRHSTRKIASTKRAQESQRKRSVPNPGDVVALRSSNSTPDLTAGQTGKNTSEDGESSTVCRNCHTTNTPLWRRDPEGQPLCTSFLFICVV